MEAIFQTLAVCVISIGITTYVNVRVITFRFDDLKQQLEKSMGILDVEWHQIRVRLHDIEDWIAGQKAIAHLKQLKGEL